ncbi:MAG: YCF48-related protein [candidate division KSB1 bacterium]|nr:YCF48-related protein [candidate division KSB1 bacterium]
MRSFHSFILFLFGLMPLMIHAQTDFWQQTNGPIGATVTEMAISPTTGTIVILIEDEGLFRSIDDGDTWTAATTELNNTKTARLVPHPDGAFFALTPKTLYRSTDDGYTWQVIRNAELFQTMEELAIDPQNGDIFVASLRLFDGVISQSTDNGQTWQKFANEELDKIWGIHDLAVSPTSGALFLASERAGVFRSDDRGKSWQPVNSGLSATEIMAVAVHPEGDVFIATGKDSSFSVLDRYVYRSSNEGETWTRVHINSVEATSFVFTPWGDIFAGLAGNGILRSSNGGQSWQTMNNGLRSLYVFDMSVKDEDRIYAVTHCAGVFISHDRGVTWEPINADLSYLAILSLSINSINGQVFAGSHCGGIFRSTDNGLTWTWTGLQGAQVTSLTSNLDGQIFAGTSYLGLGASGDVYRSSDNGATWQNISPDNDFFLSLAFDADGNLYAGTGFFQLCGFSFCDYGDIYRSSDNGVNWKRVANKLDDHVFALAAHPNGRIFAGTREGLYRSFGEFWHKILKEDTRSLLADPSTGDLFVGTHAGIRRTSDEGETWTSLLDWSDDYTWALSSNSEGHIFAATQKARRAPFHRSWPKLDIRQFRFNQTRCTCPCHPSRDRPGICRYRRPWSIHPR